MQDYSTREPFFPENLQDYAPWVAKYGLLASYGECQCGCGADAPIAKKPDSRWGHAKGAPQRYISNHHERSSDPRSLPSDEAPGTRKIALTQGLFAIVDEADYEWLMQWKWCARHSNRTWYAVRNLKLDDHGRGSLGMHAAIMGQKGIDHIDGNGLNNIRLNLRAATSQQNNRNVAVQRNNKSGFKGVHWHPGAEKWRAKICINGKSQHLGYFVCLEDAARAYDCAAQEAWGEYAWLNFDERRTGL